MSDARRFDRRQKSGDRDTEDNQAEENSATAQASTRGQPRHRHKDTMYQEEDNEYMWTSDQFSSSKKSPLNLALQDFEQSNLRCPICHEFYRNAVYINTCYHTYCSECIRIAFRNAVTSMRRKKVCPTCNQDIQEDENKVLIPDYGLQRAVHSYVQLRGTLRDTLIQWIDVGQEETGLHSEHTTQQQALHNHAEKSEPNTEKTLKPESHTVLSHTGNRNVQETVTQISRPQRKSTPHYHGMKRKQLENLCRDEGLSTEGSEVELRDRHQEFILLWNAECDSQIPKSQDALIAELNRREKGRKKERTRASLKLNGSNMTTNASNKELTKGFDRLIQDARAKGLHSSKKYIANDSATSDTEISDIWISEISECNKSPTFNSDNANAPTPASSARAVHESSRKRRFHANPMEHDNSMSTLPGKPMNPYKKPGLTPKDNHSYSKHTAEDNIDKQVPLSSLKCDPSTKSSTLQNGAGSVILLNTNSSMNANDLSHLTSSEIGKPNSTPRKSVLGSWQCGRCTFINLKFISKTAKCEMCSATRSANEM